MPNSLVEEKSPYLLQHANNPVDWFPWSEKAFNKARDEQKPIFLSVGYSTCHWCHVMARESFENEEIARLMNSYFVCIKVDREERPDVDRVYMTALQAMGQSGGWPMSMFLTPELKPFYGGTYYPPVARYGRGGFPDVLQRVHEAWQLEKEKVAESAENITQFLRDTPGPEQPGSVPGPEILDLCFDQLSNTFDVNFGGFGKGPKFPRPAVFNFLLRYASRTGTEEAREMTGHTLSHMATGGIYDHVGGGFHRYSVDGEWRVPHFEKMLYDQAQLVTAYLETFQVTHDPFYAAVAREVIEYVLGCLAHSEGGFYSAEDADSPKPEEPSEHGEGAFYVWRKAEITEALGAEKSALFCAYYGVEEEGNAPYDPQMEFTGRNILYVARPIEDVAEQFGKSEDEARMSIADARKILADVRARRPRPHLDDKILTSWNGLMIGALARGAQSLGDERYLQAARRAAEFILIRLRDESTGSLMRRFRDGEARFAAQLDDYAFFVQGLLDLYEAAHEARWLLDAVHLTSTMITLFADPERGGFFDSPGSDPTVLARLKEPHDGAEPSGNSIAVMNLLRLAEFTDNHEWRTLAEQAIGHFHHVLKEHPVIMPQMAAAVEFLQTPRKQIVIAGRRNDSPTELLFAEIFGRYLPNRIVLFVDGGEEQEKISTLLPFTGSLGMIDEKPTAYVCEDYVCRLPTADPAVLGEILDGKQPAV